uniref:Uncharacterized protein n=1 Tax=Entomoneis paludosa TaxID=265537 RepID=A0A6U3EAI7_9STRA|mmetsp:Transcript_6049/g.12737  ORF Transcript_6049/g.12737 Transcript_6049/m.12737 type:complete len:375 (+) Transcript_6049:862-1986(+)|eukprot:CAMPEP_0172454868 /NCGR_PEP_ID=MMETSP1065-20121228/11729_1 /TAXON_ID=265537 /ORGANISM="Amphiprora paludosa, Strain CCMP125" /LENGTH=374 /DNA_ID=CAMNT_0013207273 /DNA_START=750 /DNA_END=1874 /DNA_ORIENTATION=-
MSTTAEADAIFQLPPLQEGEYNVVLPYNEEHGFGFSILPTECPLAKKKGAKYIFNAYRSLEDGSKGPAQLCKVFHNSGDLFLYVNGVSPSTTFCESGSSNSGFFHFRMFDIKSFAAQHKRLQVEIQSQNDKYAAVGKELKHHDSSHLALEAELKIHKVKYADSAKKAKHHQAKCGGLKKESNHHQTKSVELGKERDIHWAKHVDLEKESKQHQATYVAMEKESKQHQAKVADLEKESKRQQAFSEEKKQLFKKYQEEKAKLEQKLKDLVGKEFKSLQDKSRELMTVDLTVSSCATPEPSSTKNRSNQIGGQVKHEDNELRNSIPASSGDEDEDSDSENDDDSDSENDDDGTDSEDEEDDNGSDDESSAKRARLH